MLKIAYSEVLKGKQISITLVNEMHRILLDSVRGAEKAPGQIRNTQNWIGPRGVGIEGATFIPPVPEEVPELLVNLYEYMNDRFIDPLLVNVAVLHVQFETIHSYKDGNGRLGRALIPVQMAMLDVVRIFRKCKKRFLIRSRYDKMFLMNLSFEKK